MVNEVWYDRFLEILSEKQPKKTLLVEALMDLLHIEREAAYRRLRKDVTFSIHEIVKISSAWNISLDNIVGISSGQISFLMRPINYITPSEQELNLIQQIVQKIKYLKKFPDSECTSICNKLPRQWLAGFEYLNQFYLFKWIYQYGSEKKPISFSQVNISEKKRRLTVDYDHAIKNVPNTNFIFDHVLFDNLVAEILYFHSIQMITDEEKGLIKKDLSSLLDYLLEIATNACYPETQNKVNLYVSQLNINTNYSYIYSNQIKVCFVHVFDRYEIYTFDAETVKSFKTWMQLKKSSSIQISEVDKKSRIAFFTKQHQIVDAL